LYFFSVPLLPAGTNIKIRGRKANG
jgi:hypothetical protein